MVVLNDVKHPVISDAPTSKEVGLKLTFPVWRGIFTTAGLDEEALEKLDKAVQATVESKEFKNFAENNGFPIKYRNHKEFSEFIKQEMLTYDLLVKISK